MAFNVSSLAAGVHSMRVVFSYQNGTSSTVNSSFTVAGALPSASHTLQLSQNSARTSPVDLNGATLSSNPAYIFLTPVSNVKRVDFYLDGSSTITSSETTSPLDFAHTASDGTAIAWNPASVVEGLHTLKAIVTPTSGSQETVNATFTVSTTSSPGDPNADACAPVICSQIKVTLPYVLDFNGDAGHLVDGLGVGTGFTYVLPSSHASSYTEENLFLDPSAGQLGIKTTTNVNS